MNYISKTTAYKHQDQAVYKIYPLAFGALFMEQGTGKTKVAIDIVVNKFLEKGIKRVLLIAPNKIHEQWNNEQLPEHSGINYCSFVWNSSRISQKYNREFENFVTMKTDKLKWLLVNVEAFSRDTHIKKFRNFCELEETAIIVDEATSIKNPSSNRTENINYKLGRELKKGRRLIKYFPFSKYRYILTGTMVTNNPYDLWSMFEFLKPNFFEMNYYAFRARYGIEKTDTNVFNNLRYKRALSRNEMLSIRKLNKEGNNIQNIAAITGVSEDNVNYIINHPGLSVPYKNLAELKQKIEPYSYTIRLRECADLPEQIFKTIPVELTKEQRRIYKELEKEYLTKYNGAELSVQNKLTLTTRLSQITGGFFPFVDENDKKQVKQIGANPKIESLKRELYESSGSPIIIFARFVPEIQLIEQELKKTFPEKVIETFYGQTPDKKRTENLKNFQNGEIDILVGNEVCGGVGLNLQISSQIQYFSNSYSLYYHEQSIARIMRLNQTKTCVYSTHIAKGTIDEKIYKALQEKKDLLEYFRDHTIEEFIKSY